jgi:hypothetical protein
MKSVVAILILVLLALHTLAGEEVGQTLKSGIPTEANFETVNAGFTMAINENFFNRLLKELLPAVFQLISKSFTLGSHYELDLDMFVVHLNSPKLSVNEISYNEDLTKFDTYSENNTIGFHIVDSKVNVSLDFDIFLDPPILDDKGTLEIGYDDLNIDVLVGMEESESSPGTLELNITESRFSVDPRKFYMKLDNENDFDKLLISVYSAISPALVNVISNGLTEYLQTIMDLVTGQIKMPIEIAGLSVDLGFKELPLVTPDEYVTSSYIGKISPAGKDYPFENKAQLPKWLPEGKDFQMFISDYMLKSALYTVVQLDILDVAIDHSDTSILNTDFLGTLFPDLVKKYGKHKPCKLEIRTDDSLIPELQITTKGVLANLALKMTLSVNADESTPEYEEAFTFRVNTKIQALLDIDPDLKIKMKIGDLEIKVTDIIHSNIGKIQTKTINNLMDLLLTFIKSVVNLLLSRGIDIGIFIKNLPVILKDISVTAAKGYYMFEANPYFNTKHANSQDQLLSFLTEQDFEASQLFMHPDALRTALTEGARAFQENFDKDTMLNRPGMAGIKTAFNTFEIFDLLTKDYQTDL